MNFMPAASSTDRFALILICNAAILVGIVMALREVMRRGLAARFFPDEFPLFAKRGHLNQASGSTPIFLCQNQL
jgi:hypothetical protein